MSYRLITGSTSMTACLEWTAHGGGQKRTAPQLHGPPPLLTLKRVVVMDDTINLLEETLEILRYNNKTPNDVVWVGSRNGKYVESWEEFAEQADRNYDNGYGGEEVSVDLVVVGVDWWLERWEYDGSEGWSFKKTPIPHRTAIKPGSIFVKSYDYKLDEINSR